MSENISGAPVSEAPQADSGLLEGESFDEVSSAPSEEKKVEARAPAKNIKKISYKAYGEDCEEEIDLDDVDTLAKKLSLAKGFQRSAQESAEYKKKYSSIENQHKQTMDSVQSFLKSLKDDPYSTLRDPSLGVDFKRVLEAYIEEESKDPQIKEREKVEAETKARVEREQEELRQAIKERDALKKEKEELAFQHLVDKQAQEITTAVNEALNEGALPRHPGVFQKMIDYMDIASKNQIKIHPKELVPIIKQSYIDELREMIGVGVSDDILDELLGGERIKSLRSRQLAKLKPQVVVPEPSKNIMNNLKQGDDSEKTPKYKSLKELFK